MTMSPRKRWIVVGLALSFVGFAAYVGGATPGRTQAVDATISVSSTVATTNSEATVDLIVTPEDGVTVGALLVVVSYDEGLFSPIAAECTVPTFPGYGFCDASEPGQVDFAFASISEISGVVATITFNTTSIEATANLGVAATTCADWYGIDLTCATQDGSITITQPTPTPTPTPFPPSSTPTPTPGNVWGDVNCDGNLNSVDALTILRKNAALPVFQYQPCPILGAPYP